LLIFFFNSYSKQIQPILTKQTTTFHLKSLNWKNPLLPPIRPPYLFGHEHNPKMITIGLIDWLVLNANLSSISAILWLIIEWYKHDIIQQCYIHSVLSSFGHPVLPLWVVESHPFLHSNYSNMDIIYYNMTCNYSQTCLNWTSLRPTFVFGIIERYLLYTG
jgi:hypothetical protein